MKLKDYSISDLSEIELRIWDAYYKACEETANGDESKIPVRDTIETKLAEIKLEINTRITNLINE